MPLLPLDFHNVAELRTRFYFGLMIPPIDGSRGKVLKAFADELIISLTEIKIVDGDIRV